MTHRAKTAGLAALMLSGAIGPVADMTRAKNDLWELLKSQPPLPAKPEPAPTYQPRREGTRNKAQRKGRRQ